jgi:hypothetical protein
MVKPDRKEMNLIKRVVLTAADGRPNVSEFLARLKGVHPDLDAALDGIYCGHDGRVSETVGDWNRSICFGWHSTESRSHVVEYAYLA